MATYGRFRVENPDTAFTFEGSTASIEAGAQIGRRCVPLGNLEDTDLGKADTARATHATPRVEQALRARRSLSVGALPTFDHREGEFAPILTSHAGELP